MNYITKPCDAGNKHHFSYVHATAKYMTGFLESSEDSIFMVISRQISKTPPKSSNYIVTFEYKSAHYVLDVLTSLLILTSGTSV